MRTEYRVWVGDTRGSSWISTAESEADAVFHALDALDSWDGVGEVIVSIYPTDVEDEEEND